VTSGYILFLCWSIDCFLCLGFSSGCKTLIRIENIFVKQFYILRSNLSKVEFLYEHVTFLLTFHFRDYSFHLTVIDCFLAFILLRGIGRSCSAIRCSLAIYSDNFNFHYSKPEYWQWPQSLLFSSCCILQLWLPSHVCSHGVWICYGLLKDFWHVVKIFCSFFWYKLLAAIMLEERTSCHC